MKTDYFKIFFLLSIVFAIVATILRVTHFMEGQMFLIITLVLTLVYIIIGIVEVNQSSRPFSSKLLWSLGFIFLNFFTALLWLINRRERKFKV